ncbi:shikimate dehydrogenase [Acinetobacter sp. S40]|uniref:shikimate dehydrogenase family protein n=1 Tax=unclassified Acinetobacter TaxID=196816 RepID=UPI00190DFFD3|nr:MULTISPECIES: shikimate dehydrogenase [unclassified Acinetobacter]MBJ9984919.1 shikimate dehydrogenase [Acinetobacter sp. S40]MBK0063090.1 shikimate dehydrogenase [Acinetobacter sp. S55]MBK0066492.1 shikimate dehydrogenase [Acinetobacter sp. S54]
MDIQLNGSTRLYFVVGHPIVQVKSPEGVTLELIKKGLNAIVAPADVAPEHFPNFIQQNLYLNNTDGLIVTVPHKISALSCCQKLTARAQFIGAVNTIRRCDEGWQGDMLDGKGMVQAIRNKNIELKNKRVILAGAGGAGKAIAYELLLAEVRELAIFEVDQNRQQQLVEQLQQLHLGKVIAHDNNPKGFDVAVNATPMGMNGDPSAAFQLEQLTPGMSIADVVTSPENTPFVQHATALGCNVVKGTDMFVQVRDLMVTYLLKEDKEQQDAA